MKKIIPYIVAILLTILALIPPGNLKVSTPNADWWPFCTAGVIFLCLLTTILKSTPFLIKIIAVLAILNSFLSVVPFFSMAVCYSVAICIYYFLLCLKVENWTPVFSALKIVVLMNIILFFVQQLGHDTLFNFSAGPAYLPSNKNPESVFYYGSIGQHMQMATFSVIVTAFLISINPFYFIFPIITAIFCASTWTFLSVGIGAAVYLSFKNIKLSLLMVMIFVLIFMGYAIFYKKFSENINDQNGRMLVWSKTVKLSKEHPFIGYGIGSFKILFNQLNPNKVGRPWVNAHNFFIQMAFEFGYPAMILFVMFWLGLFVLLIHQRQAACVSGLCMIASEMMCHFPDRQMQCVFIMIAFMAYCYRRAHGFDSLTTNYCK